MSSEGAPPFHPEWKRRFDRALAMRVLCVDCMAAEIDVPKRYLADYLGWLRRNVMILSSRPCQGCGLSIETFGLPKARPK